MRIILWKVREMEEYPVYEIGKGKKCDIVVVFLICEIVEHIDINEWKICISKATKESLLK